MNNQLDPDMPAQELRLHMGEMTAQEERTARAAIRWANSAAATAPGDLIAKVLDWRLKRANEIHGIFMGEMEWDEEKCPMCELDEILPNVADGKDWMQKGAPI